MGDASSEWYEPSKRPRINNVIAPQLSTLSPLQTCGRQTSEANLRIRTSGTLLPLAREGSPFTSTGAGLPDGPENPVATVEDSGMRSLARVETQRRSLPRNCRLAVGSTPATTGALSSFKKTSAPLKAGILRKRDVDVATTPQRPKGVTPLVSFDPATKAASSPHPAIPPYVLPGVDAECFNVTSPPNAIIQEDRLGKLVLKSLRRLMGGVSFLELCVLHRGRSCLGSVHELPHPAAAFLANLRQYGASVRRTSPNWSRNDLDAAIQRGAHRSTLAYSEFLREEFADMVEAGQWLVLPYSWVRDLPGLCLSPTGVVPQRDRRPRTIVDYSFSLVNQTTLLDAPDSLQFGHALLRILQRLHRADTRRGKIYLAKIDVADAFMRVWLQLPSLLALGAILPSYPGEDPLVALPLILPMGWLSSPQYLCAVTETIADLANHRFAEKRLDHTPHRLDELADSKSEALPKLAPMAAGIPPPVVKSRGARQESLNMVDVFMDDFVLCSQLPLEERNAARRTLFDCIDQVIRPLEPHDNPKRKEPNSVKKLGKGDGAWSTRKIILGWLIDTEQRTIELPPHRRGRLEELLAKFPPHQKRTSRRKWQQLIGELRSMVLAIPGGRGLFSQLQSVLDYSATARPSDRLFLSKAVHDQLDDFRWLAQNLSSRPTRWGELIDSDPLFLGAVDASGDGMGGVWLHYDNTQRPLFWRHKFDAALVKRLVSATNKNGTLTNSDFEQTGLVCHQDIISQVYDIRECTICAMTDNMAALSREQRGSTSVDAPSSYLCRLSALHQRKYRYRMLASHIPGPVNSMADDLSRLWELDDSQMLDCFNSLYPQALPWRICQLRPDMLCSVMLALSKKRCKPEFLEDDKLPPPSTNGFGMASVSNTSWTPTCPKLPRAIRSSGSNFSQSKFEPADCPPAKTASDLARWRMCSTLLHRRSPSWVSTTLVADPEPAISILDWLDN